VHVVAHSFGGIVAIAVALRKRVPLASLVIAEAPAAELLATMGEAAHYQAFRDMTEAYFDAFCDGEEEAIATMIDFYGGPGTFASWPERVRAYAIETTAVNIRDWASVYGFPLSPALLAAIDMPALVLWGARSHPAVRRANELLGRCLKGAARTAVEGAAHFMISTHATEVAGLVGAHIDRAAAAPMPVTMRDATMREAAMA
jgi:pimeloyl-ACP methyl ester carboxylesterase